MPRFLDVSDTPAALARLGGLGGFSPQQYGAVGDGVTDDTSAIQGAVDAASAAGGGVVALSSGTFLVSAPIVLPSAVRLIGAGSAATTIKLADGSDCNVIESVDYATLSGTSAWLVTSEGVPFSFGAEHLRIDGNKSNNTAGDGIRWYGKRFRLIDVVVHDCAGNGIRTECADVIGQAEVDDMPESRIDQVWARSNDGHGVHFLGTHDSRIGSVFSLFNGGHGLYFNSTPGYSGFCDVEFIHNYGNGGDGVRADAACSFGQIITEGNTGHGLYLLGSGANHMVGYLWCFNNGGAAVPSVKIDAAQVIVGMARLTLNNGGVGWQQNGVYGVVGTMIISGQNTAATGLEVAANGFSVENAYVHSCSASGGVGVSIGSGLSAVKVSATTSNCDTHIAYSGSSTVRSHFDFRGYTAAGQTAVSGTVPGASNIVTHAISGAGGSDTATYLYEPQVLDSNGNELLEFSAASSAVNHLTVRNAPTGGSPTLLPTGSDTNIGLGITPKGSGPFYIFVSTGQTPKIEARGADANHDLNLVSKGTGVVKANNQPVGVKVAVPASAGAAGVVGQWAAEAGWLYICVATNTWQRVAIATW